MDYLSEITSKEGPIIGLVLVVVYLIVKEILAYLRSTNETASNKKSNGDNSLPIKSLANIELKLVQVIDRLNAVHTSSKAILKLNQDEIKLLDVRDEDQVPLIYTKKSFTDMAKKNHEILTRIDSRLESGVREITTSFDNVSKNIIRLVANGKDDK